MTKILLCFFLITHVVVAQEVCTPTIEIEYNDFNGKPKGLQEIKLYLIKANNDKIVVDFGRSTTPLIGVGLQFESQGRSFYFQFSSDSTKDICINYNLKYVYQTEDSLGIRQKTFLSLEYVDKGEKFFLCNEKMYEGVTENLLNKSVFKIIQRGSTHMLIYKHMIPDIRKHFRELKMYDMINLDNIKNHVEDEFCIEIPKMIPQESAEWGSDEFAYVFTLEPFDPRRSESYLPVLYIFNDWNQRQRPLMCLNCTKIDSTNQNGKIVYFGVSESGLYWKYFYHKNFGVWYANVKKEDLALFEHSIASFKVGAEIDKAKLKIK